MKDWQSALTKDERKVLRTLSTPAKVQDFINALAYNHVPGNDTCMSPRRVMQERKAQCVEGAMLAALALRVHGHRPLILDLLAAEPDSDHVVAVFQIDGHWGAISKTNHAVLRYREPVYKTLRELAMSYFHEYFTHDGKKTLRGYSGAIDLSRFDAQGWMTSEDPVWYVPEYLVEARHSSMLSPAQRRRLRRADPVEIAAGKIEEWPTG